MRVNFTEQEQLMANLSDISAIGVFIGVIFLLKLGTSSTCMRDGEHSLLTQQPMILKSISEMFVRQQNSLDMEMMQF